MTTSSDGDLVVGIDLGTSGSRAVAMTLDGVPLEQAQCRYADRGLDPRQPGSWWQATQVALNAVANAIDTSRVRAVAVDGTSGTVLPIDAAGEPLATPLMYNDAVTDMAVLERIAATMPADSAAGGATSGLAKALQFQAELGRPVSVLHQADWIVGRLSGDFTLSDANNALKTGYDPVAGCWPDWIDATGLDRSLLPHVHVPGAITGHVSQRSVQRFGFPADTRIVAGTTDGCASFLATGAQATGDAVTALGTTLTIKLLSDKPVFSPAHGIYSHRIGDWWLVGGASNTGGGVLAHYFDDTALQRLSERIDIDTDPGLDYYPLPGTGERFPVNDAAMVSRVAPRPADDAVFLHGLLLGMARIEAQGFRTLQSLGAPAPKSLRTVGGGAANPVWRALRQREIGVPFLDADSQEAAVGTAQLARRALLAERVS